MLKRAAEVLGYVFFGRKADNGTAWAKGTIEKFLSGDAVSDIEFFYASRILEMTPEKRGAMRY